MNDAGPGGVAPLVSVVVPTRDRPGLLATTLRSILRQHVGPDRGRRRRRRVCRQRRGRGRLLEAGWTTAGSGSCASRCRRASARHATAGWRPRRAVGSRSVTTTICGLRTRSVEQVAASAPTGRSWAYTGSVDINRANAVTKGVVAAASRTTWSANCPGTTLSRAAARASWWRGPRSTQVGRLRRVGWDRAPTGTSGCGCSRVGPPACVPEPLVAYRLHPANMSLSERRMVADFAVLRARYGTVEEATFRRYLFWWSLRSQRQKGGALALGSRPSGARPQLRPPAAGRRPRLARPRQRGRPRWPGRRYTAGGSPGG